MLWNMTHDEENLTMTMMHTTTTSLAKSGCFSGPADWYKMEAGSEITLLLIGNQSSY